MTLRHEIIEKMIEMKQKFRETQKIYVEKQHEIEENSQNFMKKVQNSIMDIKHDYTALTEKTSQLAITNNDLDNKTQTVQNEFRESNRIGM